jgi:hypothetical protein
MQNSAKTQRKQDNFLSIRESIELLKERGIVRHMSSMRQLCREKFFPNAKKIRSPRGGAWLIPQEDLLVAEFKIKERKSNSLE